MQVCGAIWKYIKIYGGIWGYMEVYGSALRYMKVYESIWRYMVVYDGICEYMKVYGGMQGLRPREETEVSERRRRECGKLMLSELHHLGRYEKTCVFEQIM